MWAFFYLLQRTLTQVFFFILTCLKNKHKQVGMLIIRIFLLLSEASSTGLGRRLLIEETSARCCPELTLKNLRKLFDSQLCVSFLHCIDSH